MEPIEVTLPEILEARERRAARQQELLAEYGLPLVSFTMNIAGPVKNSPHIRRGFQYGERLLRGQLARTRTECVHAETIDAPTGCEGLYVVDTDAQALKRLTEDVEAYGELGRLFDMDVLTPEGVKLDRAIPRRCLLCGGDAKACASRRVHTVPELQARTRDILDAALEQYDVETVANFACRALLYEVCVTPKPGLVDRDNNGSHKDMDIYTFTRSASALWPYFADCTRTGRRTAERPARETFEALRARGKMAEMEMLSATGGVNTHKGAIFSMGLVCGALGRLDREAWREPETVLSEAADMARGLSARDFSGGLSCPPLSPDGDISPQRGIGVKLGTPPPVPLPFQGRGDENCNVKSMQLRHKSRKVPPERGDLGGFRNAVPVSLTRISQRGETRARQPETAGERFFVQYGIKGVRGEAEAGFPTVLKYGLPVLEAGLSAGHSPDIAGAAALLSILIHTHDTNMLARSDRETESAIRALVRDVLEAVPYPDAGVLRKLDAMFTRQNLSPGGSADLLSLCWLLHFLKEEI